jgi:hypothetical protein
MAQLSGTFRASMILSSACGVLGGRQPLVQVAMRVEICFQRALCGTDQAAHHADENEHQRVGVNQVADATAHGQQKIAAATPHRHQYRDAEHDGDCLQPPGQRAELVRAAGSSATVPASAATLKSTRPVHASAAL